MTLLLLAEPGSPPTAAEITERLRCRYPFDGLELSLQTTRDDLRLLRQVGFPVIPVDERGEEIDLDAFESLSGKLKNTRWALRDPSKLPVLLGEGLPRPSAADVLALDLLRSLLCHTHPAGFWLAATTRRLLDEVAQLLDPRPRSPRHCPAGTVTVRLRVAEDLAPRLRDLLPPSLRLCPSTTGIFVEFEAPNDDATERLLLSLGSGAVVESPLDLRRRIALHHATASAHYERAPEPPEAHSGNLDHPSQGRKK